MVHLSREQLIYDKNRHSDQQSADQQLTCWSSMPAADVLTLLLSPLFVQLTMMTMMGRATQSMMRLMGRWTGQLTSAGGIRSVGASSNKNLDVKSWNTGLMFPLVVTWHLHALLLSSLRRFVTRVMLQRERPISSYLHQITQPSVNQCFIYCLYCCLWVLSSNTTGRVIFSIFTSANPKT